MGAPSESAAAITARWQRVRALFEAACEKPAEERGRWLSEQCAADPELLERVERLLAADELVGGRLEPPPAPLSSRSLRGTDAVERIGTHVGPYLLEHLLGVGGMGAVYLARRADEAFEKRVAIKLIKRGMDTDDILRRFRTERQVLAHLEHPGVARLLDGGSTTDGLPYLVMEHVEGLPLDRWCDARQLGLPERVELFRKVCEAVDFAHRRGIVHRDLKPSNVLVTAEGEPKLLDFGIAKIVDPTDSVATVDVTATELRLMTPEYASPEQLRGEAVGPSSDVYALGVVLYELLTGRHPHPTSSRQRVELERAICEVEPAPPSAVVLRPATGRDGAPADELAARRAMTVRGLRRRLSGDLDTIVLAALRKEPARRYPTAGELAADLGRLLERLPVRARPDTWRYRAAKLVRRNRRLVAATLAMIVLLVAGLATSSSLYLRAEEARHAAVEREYEARISSATAAIEAGDVVRARRDLELAPEVERGWEWRHLTARLDRSEGVVAEVEGSILLGIALDPAGRWMAVGGNDRAVTLFDRSSGEELARAATRQYVRPIAFLEGGQRLIGLVERGGACVWEVPSLELALDVGPVGGVASGLAVEPGERWFALGSTDGTVQLRELGSGALLRAWAVSGAAIHTLAVDPTGERVAAASADGSLSLWDAASGERCAGPVQMGGAPVRLRFGPGGRSLAAGLARGEVALFDGTSLRPISRATGHSEPVRGLLFHPDGARLVSASLDGLLRVWSLPTLSPVASMLGHGSEVSDVALDPVTGGLLSVDALGRVKAWRWDADDVRRWRGPAGWYMGLDVSPDGERLVTTGWTTKEQGTATVEVREVSSGALLWSRALDGTNCTGAAFSPDGTRIAVTAAPPSLRILDADTGEELAASELEGAREALSLCWTPDGSTLLTCGSGVGVVLHEARGLAPIGRYESGAGRCTTVAMHPGGALFLAARRPDAAELVDARSLEVLAVLRGHEGNITSADFSPSGDLVATGSRDGTVRLWSVPGGVELAVLRGHSSWPTDVAFSPDGRRLASVSEDHTVRLWSMPDGRELATLRGHRALVRAALFAPDGSYLATLSVDGELRIWDAPHLAE